VSVQKKLVWLKVRDSEGLFFTWEWTYELHSINFFTTPVTVSFEKDCVSWSYRYALRVSPASKRMHAWLMCSLANGFAVDWCETKTHQTTDQIQSYWNRMLPSCEELCFLYITRISHTVMTWSPFRHNVKRKPQAPRQHISAVTREAKGGYTLVTSPRIVTHYRDSVDGSRARVTYQKLVTR